MKRYEVKYTVTVDLTVKNEDMIDRVYTPQWQEMFYQDIGELGAVDMLAMSCGLNGDPIDILDGWADCSIHDIEYDVSFELDEIKEKVDHHDNE